MLRRFWNWVWNPENPQWCKSTCLHLLHNVSIIKDKNWHTTSISKTFSTSKQTTEMCLLMILFTIHKQFCLHLQTAVKNRCSSMHFIVAESNKASIDFYKRRGASDLSLQEGWRLFRIDKENLLKISAEEWAGPKFQCSRRDGRQPFLSLNYTKIVT